MTTRVGLALARDAVRAIAIRRGRIVWAAEAPLEPEAELSAVIESLLGAAPVPRFPRPTVFAAVGPHAAQLRNVAGLPEGQDVDTLSAIIRENASSFFLKNGAPLVTTPVRRTDSGATLAGAIDRPRVDAVRDACRARRWQLGCVAPVAISLLHAVQDPAFAWTEGKVRLYVTRTAGGIESVRTVAAAASEPSPPDLHPVPELARLGTDALRYADAYGAAMLEQASALTLDAMAAGAWTHGEVRRRLIAPAALLAFGIVSVALTPLAAFWAADRAAASVRAIPADQWQAVGLAMAQLDTVTAILDDVDAFGQGRINATRATAEVARALPANTALVSMELSGEQGQMVALSAHPEAVLAAVQHVHQARAVELVGPVRRESAAAREVQRVTVRWQWERQ